LQRLLLHWFSGSDENFVAAEKPKQPRPHPLFR
jgi:hypothetical protein